MYSSELLMLDLSQYIHSISAVITMPLNWFLELRYKSRDLVAFGTKISGVYRNFVCPVVLTLVLNHIIYIYNLD